MASMKLTMQDIRTRLVAMTQESVPGTISDSYPSARDEYTRGLNWHFRVARVTPAAPMGAGFFWDIIEFVMTVTVGKVAEGYDGELEDYVQYEVIPDVLEYFRKRRNLVYEADTRPPNYLAGETIISNLGLTAVPAGDEAGTMEWASRFLLKIPLITDQDQCYY